MKRSYSDNVTDRTTNCNDWKRNRPDKAGNPKTPTSLQLETSDRVVLCDEKHTNDFHNSLPKGVCDVATESNENNLNDLVIRIKSCGSDVSRCMELLKCIPSTTLSSSPSCSMTSIHEDCYHSALNVCKDAANKIKKKTLKKKKNQATKPNAISVPTEADDDEILRNAGFILERNPTEACRLKYISICGILGHCEQAVELFETQQKRLSAVPYLGDSKMKDRVDEGVDNKIYVLLQATLAACVSSGRWKLALQVLSSPFLSIPISTSSCNIVFNAMCTASAGTSALELIQKMMSGGPVDENDLCNIRWPRPDARSFLFAMNALISKAMTDRRDNKDIDDENHLVYVDNAYNLLNAMVQCHDLSGNEDNKCLPNKTHYDVLIRAYRHFGSHKMVTFIANIICDKQLDIYPDPLEIRESGLNPVASKSCASAVPMPSINNQSDNNDVMRNNNEQLFAHWNDDATSNDFVKHGRGRAAYWAYATYIDTNRKLTVALQPHREPSKNGIKILLYDDTDSDNCEYKCSIHTDGDIVDGDSKMQRRNLNVISKYVKFKKVGFLLLLNSSIATRDHRSDGTESLDKEGIVSLLGKSSFLGMHIHLSYRKEKLSKVFLAIWLDLCSQANIIPETGVINKPLLGLILQDTFGFIPKGNGGFDVEIVERQEKHIESLTDDKKGDGKNGNVIYLYSPTASKSLVGGAIATIDLKRENIKLVTEAPTCRSGRVFRLGCSLMINHGKLCGINDISSSTLFRENVDCQLKGPNGSGRLVYYKSSDVDWKSIMLGK